MQMIQLRLLLDKNDEICFAHYHIKHLRSIDFSKTGSRQKFLQHLRWLQQSLRCIL